jgi:polyisoprenyl-phosphate glycosyltransferase
MAHISIVSPVYKAEGCIVELCCRLKLAIEPITEDFEIILVEDRSPDNSWNLIQGETEKDSRVKGIRLSRNFGQHRAITAGLDMASGDWTVIMDCDLQDLPEDIPLLYSKALEGYEIVVAQFEERAESGMRQVVSKIFWKSLSWLAGIPFDYKTGNFRILSSSAVKSFRLYREQLRYLGGITSLIGYTSTSLPLKRGKRYAGETSYTLEKLFSAATEIVMAYSDKPLKISIVVGLVISGLSIIIGFLIFLLATNGMVEVSGWASVMVSLYFIGGLIIANLGVLGHYIGKIFDETKRRPLYIVESKTYENLSTPKDSSSHILDESSGKVIWITGLSGSGKSTLAREVVSGKKHQNGSILMLDGDELREVFGAVAANADNHGREGRLALAMQYAQLCRVLAIQGKTVVIATISLFKEVHAWNRKNLPNYFEVYLKVPIEELRIRDPKGIYKKYDAGELNNVSGLDLEVDEPLHANMVIEFNKRHSVRMIAGKIINKCKI